MSFETFVMSLANSAYRLPFLIGKHNEDCGAPNDPGWLLCYGVDDMSNRIWSELLKDSTSLQTQCLRVLAKSLPLYVKQCGAAVMVEQMSFFPPWTLMALSIECCRQGSMTESVAYILGHHPEVNRLSIIMPPSDGRKKIDLASILYPCIRRIELGNMCLEKSVLDDMLSEGRPQLTHLATRHCQIDDSIILHSVPDTLQVLDLSDNDWVTDEFLLDFLERRGHHATHLVHVNVAGCRFLSTQQLVRLNFDFRGSPLISTKRQRI